MPQSVTLRSPVGTRHRTMSVRCPLVPAWLVPAWLVVASWVAVLMHLLPAGGDVTAAERLTERSRPNIVLMLSDDQGWDGLSVAMHPDVPESRGRQMHTPHLARLAAEGMRFSAGYAPAPVCSPTRISLQTGQSPAALQWTKAAPPEAGRRLVEPRQRKNISREQVTIAEVLRSAGYATAHFGKWHLGGGGPGEHGYDVHDGDTGNEQAYDFQDPNPVDIFGMAERAAAFLERNAREGRPVYLQLSWNALHAPENALRATRARYEQQLRGQNPKQIARAALTEDLDTGVGRVLEALDRLQLASSTYVIYLSDNGAGGGRKVLNSGKGGLWEGGIRVPWIVRGPGVAAASWCHVRVVGYDWFPTFCEWASIDPRQLPPGLEGGSLTGLLTHGGQGEVRRPREELVFHFPHYQGDTPHSAILLGDLKLLHFYEDQRDMLFDLNRDLGERHDLAAERPADVARLRQRLDDYLAAVQAQIPTPNPEFDPQNPSAAAQRRRGGQAGGNPNKKRSRPGTRP